ncbi:MAG: adenylate/guanylate cyclase domain-containing protein [Pseudomonadota bacterium]
MSEEAEDTLDAVIAEVLELEHHNELVRAFDRAKTALNQFPGSLWLKHRSVLCLLKLGSIRSAQTLLRELSLVGRLEEELAILPAQIAKQEAIEAPAELTQDLSRIAAEIYESVFRGPTGTFASGIEAASMRLMAGDTDRAQDLARAVLALLERQGSAVDAYAAAATRCEALLLIGETVGARRALREAAALTDDDLSARVTTRKQIRLVCRHLGVETAFLALLETPRVLHYATAPDAPFAREDLAAAEGEETARAMAAALVDERIRYGYGTLACYRDIVCAEALIAAGIELHLVLPQGAEVAAVESRRVLDRPWRARHQACCAGAASIRSAASDGSILDTALVAFAGEFANGLARLHAGLLDSDVRTVSLTGGEVAAVTAAAVGSYGAVASVTSPGGPVKDCPHDSPAAPWIARRRDAPVDQRRPRAMLFGDAAGFSRLPDRQVLTFFTTVMNAIDEELAAYAEALVHRNTWGDGFSLVFATIEAAATCALALQERLELLDFEAHGLPSGIGFRMGGHYGLVYAVTDPITKRPNYIGAEMSRTARIEPITPEGEVYVTDVFAAHLVRVAPQAFRCDYVGHIPAAKDWGEMPMYLLRRAADLSRVRSYETVGF